jgi:hypothetical protein
VVAECVDACEDEVTGGWSATVEHEPGRDVARYATRRERPSGAAHPRRVPMKLATAMAISASRGVDFGHVGRSFRCFHYGPSSLSRDRFERVAKMIGRESVWRSPGNHKAVALRWKNWWRENVV